MVDKLKEKKFMKLFSGKPCLVCGRTHAFKDHDGNDIPTCGHHILEKSVYPEYRLDEMNVVSLCAIHHVPLAHEKKNEFQKVLYKKDRARWEYCNERSRRGFVKDEDVESVIPSGSNN